MSKSISNRPGHASARVPAPALDVDHLDAIELDRLAEYDDLVNRIARRRAAAAHAAARR